MRVLIIHQNFPGQFKHLAAAWAQRPGWEVIGIGRDTAPGMPPQSGVRWIPYSLHRQPSEAQHHYLHQMESAVLHGQAVVRLMQRLKSNGYRPDVILAHPGWGETLYAKDIYPDTRLIHLCEWYYGQPGADIGFDPEFPADLDTQAKVRTWNALHNLNLANCDAGIAPTRWQWQQHPQAYRDKISVIHEGIPTGALNPDAKAVLTLANGHTVKAGEPIITYVARNLEPYRGFHTFMRALQRIQRHHRTCHALIVGGDDVSYGKPPAKASNWRQQMLSEVRLDATRTHFLGRVPYETYKKVLQVSAAHVYLTYPFVLSWSMLEAMASACLVVGSNTPPVNEVLHDGVNGYTCDMLNPGHIAELTVAALETPPEKKLHLRMNAWEGARSRYGLEQGINAYSGLLGGVEPPDSLIHTHNPVASPNQNTGF